jgi:hypothetical protein
VDNSLRKALLEVCEQPKQRGFLRIGAGVSRLSLRIQTATINNSDRVFVVVEAMRSSLL